MDLLSVIASARRRITSAYSYIEYVTGASVEFVGTSFTIRYPSNVQAGDVTLAFIATDSPYVLNLSGWHARGYGAAMPSISFLANSTYSVLCKRLTQADVNSLTCPVSAFTEAETGICVSMFFRNCRANDWPISNFQTATAQFANGLSIAAISAARDNSYLVGGIGTDNPAGNTVTWRRPSGIIEYFDADTNPSGARGGMAGNTGAVYTAGVLLSTSQNYPLSAVATSASSYAWSGHILDPIDSTTQNSVNTLTYVTSLTSNTHFIDLSSTNLIQTGDLCIIYTGGFGDNVATTTLATGDGYNFGDLAFVSAQLIQRTLMQHKTLASNELSARLIGLSGGQSSRMVVSVFRPSPVKCTINAPANVVINSDDAALASQTITLTGQKRPGIVAGLFYGASGVDASSQYTAIPPINNYYVSRSDLTFVSGSEGDFITFFKIITAGEAVTNNLTLSMGSAGSVAAPRYQTQRGGYLTIYPNSEL